MVTPIIISGIKEIYYEPKDRYMCDILLDDL